MLIFFAGEEAMYTNAGYLYGEEFKKLAEESAVFVRVPYEADRTPAPFAEESPVPQQKLAGDNPSRDYDIKTYPTFIVADCYGNEHFRLTSKPKVDDLEKYFGKVPEKSNEANEKLAKNLDKARESWEGKDAKNAIKSILKNFKEDVIGLENQEESIRLYHEILDEARAELAELAADGSKDAAKKIKAMKSIYAKTELEVEIEEALEGMNS